MDSRVTKLWTTPFSERWRQMAHFTSWKLPLELKVTQSLSIRPVLGFTTTDSSLRLAEGAIA
jgi:hypothetical protein